MCDACRLARDAAMRALIAAWTAPGPNVPDGARIIGKLLALSVMDDRPAPERRYTVDQIMLDAYESQRRDAITLVSTLIDGLKNIQTRIIDEAGAAGDKRVVNLELLPEQNGYTLKGRDANGNPVERFEPIAYGEDAATAGRRIMLTHLAEIGEVHG